MKKYFLILSYPIVVRLFLKLYIGVKFSNTNFLKKEKQFILIANHNSHLDTMAIQASIPASLIDKVRPVAAQEHFGKTKMLTFWSNLFINPLLIQKKYDNQNHEEEPITKMDKALKDGFSLLIFPEGTRGIPDQIAPFKAGVALLLKKNPHISYIPIYLKNMGKSMPKDSFLMVPYECEVVFGKPTKIDSENVDEILNKMKLEIENLQHKTQNNDFSI